MSSKTKPAKPSLGYLLIQVRNLRAANQKLTETIEALQVQLQEERSKFAAAQAMTSRPEL